MNVINNVNGVDLQATLSAQTCGLDRDAPVWPHHPVTCSRGTRLRYHEDGRFACEHAEAPAGDIRTRAAVDASVALLIIELGSKL